MADEEVKLAPDTGNPAEPAVQTETPVETTEPVIAAAGPEPAAVEPDWRDDWREKMAGGDEKELKRLQRFKSPVDVYKSNRELEKRMSSKVDKLPEGATEEQVAAWRKENGIPEKPEGYLENLPSGLVIGDADKPVVGEFLKAMHGENAPPAIAAKALDWYYAEQERQIAAQADADKEYRKNADDALRAEWGTEYRANINSIMSFLDAAPETEDGAPLKQLLMGARLSDGSMLGNNPAALKWLAQLATDANPAGFIAPGGGGSQIDGVKAEIAKIEGVMRTNRRAYDKDEAMQARLRQLYDAEEKLNR